MTQPRKQVALDLRNPASAVDRRLHERQDIGLTEELAYGVCAPIASGGSPGGSEGGEVSPSGMLYLDQGGGTPGTYGTLVGSINGSNCLFTVSQGRYKSGTLKVWRRGLMEGQEEWSETAPSSGTFTFTTAPEAGDIIIVEYRVE